MSQSLKNSANGFVVLITVLILGIVLTTVAVFLLLTGSNSSITGLAVDGGIEARAASNACAELALLAIQTTPTLTTPSNGSHTITSNQNCTYAISGTTTAYTILSTGTVTFAHNTYYHKMTIVTTQTTPSISISSWQDTP